MNKLKKLEIIGFVFVIITGSLSHFVYNWSNQQKWIGLFFATNESTFEHLKLLFYPFLLYSVFEYYVLKKSSQADYIYKLPCGKTIALLAGLLSIITLFYTYTGVFGVSIVFIDISIFILAVLLSFIISYFLITRETDIGRISPYIYIVFLIILFLYFLVFSIYPPDIPLFNSPKKF